MKTKYKYIEFIQDAGEWDVVNRKSRAIIGGIAYYDGWREYIFVTSVRHPAIYSTSCLNDIIDFIKQLSNFN